MEEGEKKKKPHEHVNPIPCGHMQCNVVGLQSIFMNRCNIYIFLGINKLASRSHRIMTDLARAGLVGQLRTLSAYNVNSFHSRYSNLRPYQREIKL